MNQSVIAARTDKAIARQSNAAAMIWITFDKEGTHCYPAAATDPTLKDVAFLGHPHRHLFKFKVHIEVTHNDRDIEFILFKRWCQNLYDQGTLILDSRSCEMIADELFLNIATKYPNREIWIEVSEDGENGCFKKYVI